ncbi:MAG TPA: hypothetical protein VGM20_07035 [Gemmatimonadales bacterium]
MIGSRRRIGFVIPSEAARRPERSGRNAAVGSRERLRSRAIVLLLALIFGAGIGPAAGQQTTAEIDSTASYPWRLSYFPYVTAEPNDGVMAMGRVVWFQQSRWNARTSVDRQVAIEGGYSTRDMWLLRLRADMPHLATGWRAQVIAQADRETYSRADAGFTGMSTFVRAHRSFGSVEITRRIAGPVAIAARGEVVRVSAPDEGDEVTSAGSASDSRIRVGVVADLRDREYDTERGALLQGGMLGGSAAGGYHGFYLLGAFWIPATSSMVITGRGGYRVVSGSDGVPVDAWRTIPAWEDEIVAGGGFESNRALPTGDLTGSKVTLGTAEIRQRIATFPGGGLSVLGFVDGSRTPPLGVTLTQVGIPGQVAALRTSGGALEDWVVGAGGGIALRLLRSAVLTATVGRAQHATRFYLQSGWSW